MPDFPSIPLIQTNAAVDLSFCDFRTPQDWFDAFVENIVGDGSSVIQQLPVVFSASEPSAENRDSIWVKTTGSGSSDPRGLGIYIDGEWVIIPIPEDAPEPENPIPSGFVGFYTAGAAPEGWSGISSTGLPALPGGTTYQYIRRN